MTARAATAQRVASASAISLLGRLDSRLRPGATPRSPDAGSASSRSAASRGLASLGSMGKSAHPAVSIWRGLRVVETVATGALILAYASLVGSRGSAPDWLPRTVSWWHGRLARALGVRVHASGELAQGSLLVGNHVSWLDVMVLGAQGPIGFLSKSEVRRWPLAGWMAARAGTLFIERGASRAAELAEQIGKRIEAGHSFAIFPEGTTSRGLGVRQFHPRLFAIAQQPDMTVQPVALAYRRQAAGSGRVLDPSVAYVDRQSLLANLWILLRHPGLIAEVRLLPPCRLLPEDDRRSLARRTRAAILHALDLPEHAGIDEGARSWRERSRALRSATD